MNFLKALFFCFAIIFSCTAAGSSYIPREAYRYNSYFIRQARFEYGMDAPIAMLASQVHQESAWNLRARSLYANGLAEFTPDTEKWIINLFPDIGNQGAMDPHWSIRALMRYDHRLLNQVKGKDDCSDWAFALSAYNGGLGWVYKDQKLTASKGKDPLVWWNNVELYSARAPQFVKENRGYPERIIHKHQPYYLKDGRWGTEKVCK
ncbi:MAG TPA: transglycosylase SLT domain-containing protein [Methanosarcina sp.]|nr:transglycosylase SLT domain-containing protein [Methanosarcina sp.]